ncbi:TY-Chap domain-containing protein, partial [Actinomadura rubrisoli]|uniref:TY-Chap domain-containing protein n=1 Tax=Actinomadura rubrisoli TaxID=2530368 RepID=UPI003C7CF796
MLEWSEFARRLGRELAGLERDTILIVRERDESRHYVQAMREPDRLYAEAVSNNFLDGPLLLTLADEEVMSEAGWRPPLEPAPRNWWTELPEAGSPGGMPSVAFADYSRLADVMVTALRDVQGVRRPSDLVYESFHRHGTGLIELLDFGIETADPSRVTKRRSSSETLGMPPSDHTTAPTVDQSGDQADADQAARIKAEVDNARPMRTRQ